ncbi:MAG: rhodanese-like domain-containing protein [Desulfatibacillaceae bacterium]
MASGKLYSDMMPQAAGEFIRSRDEGEYALVDVRQPGEYERGHIPGAMLVPLTELKDRLGELPMDRPLLLYCETGVRSSTAAGILGGRGWSDVINLLGGYSAWEGAAAVGSHNLGMKWLSEDEPPQRIFTYAYTLEENLGEFYRKLADAAEREDVRSTFRKLARFEDSHKTRVAGLAARFEPGLSEKDLSGDLGSMVFEGGVTLEELMSRRELTARGPAGVVEIAMGFEAQAMDLYSRYAARAADETGEKALLLLAQEEKDHLESLGRLLEDLSEHLEEG